MSAAPGEYIHDLGTPVSGQRLSGQDTNMAEHKAYQYQNVIYAQLDKKGIKG